MARYNDIQYVRYYSIGSAARQPELPRKKKAQPSPRPQTARKTIVRLDALAVTGIAVAVVMLLCMAIGLAQVCIANAQVRQLQSHVANLEAENESLKVQYANGYNLAEVRLAAESMGMVPTDQVQHVIISVPEPAAAEEPGFWQQLWDHITYFFS